MSIPKNICQTLLQPQSRPLGPNKTKMTQKLNQNQMSELNKTKKMKVARLHEMTPKHLSNPTPTQNSPLGPKKVKNDPKTK